MLNIHLWFNIRDYEYDVYSLIRAFYPGCQIAVWAEGEEKPEGEPDQIHKVFFEPSAIRYTLEEAGETVLDQRTEFPETADRTEYKNHLKRLVYRSLSGYTGQQLPWGDLTGIRPVKIPLHLLEQGKSNGEIAGYLRDTYYVSREKTALAVATANRERALLSGTDWLSGYSLYVGVPFCPSICLYCSFGSHPLKQWGHLIEPYLRALKKELSFIGEQMRGRPLHTIYIGGGTPTTLSPEQLRELLGFLAETFPLGSPSGIYGGGGAAGHHYPGKAAGPAGVSRKPDLHQSPDHEPEDPGSDRPETYGGGNGSRLCPGKRAWL